MSSFGALAQEIADVFGLGCVQGTMVEAGGGEQARIWRLDTDTGSYAVKQPRRGCAPRVDGVDVAFQEAVREQTDVVMPAPVRRPGGPAVVPVGGFLVRLSAWVELLPPDTHLDPATVGGLLAALHQVDFEPPVADLAAGVDPWFWAPVGLSRWEELADRLAQARAPFAYVLRAEAPQLVALEESMEQPRDLRMCHRDLWSDNVLRTTDGDVCVVDWDSCGLADPSHELAQLLFELGEGDAGRARGIADAYARAGGPGRLERPSQLTMVIAQFGHFWEAAAEEWLAPESTAADRAHAESRVAELMSPPFTLATAVALVDALR